MYTITHVKDGWSVKLDKYSHVKAALAFFGVDALIVTSNLTLIGEIK